MDQIEQIRRYNSLDRDLDTILARGKLSGPTRDHILLALLDGEARHLRESRRRVRRALTPKLVSAAVVVLLLLSSYVLLLAHMLRDHIESRGAAGIFLEASCTDTCRPGAMLLMRLQGVSQPGYVAIMATDPRGRSFWLMPTSSSGMERVGASDGPILLSQGLKIEASMVPGVYHVQAVILDAPGDAAELESLFADRSQLRPSAETSFTVVP